MGTRYQNPLKEIIQSELALVGAPSKAGEQPVAVGAAYYLSDVGRYRQIAVTEFPSTYRFAAVVAFHLQNQQTLTKDEQRAHSWESQRLGAQRDLYDFAHIIQKSFVPKALRRRVYLMQRSQYEPQGIWEPVAPAHERDLRVVAQCEVKRYKQGTVFRRPSDGELDSVESLTCHREPLEQLARLIVSWRCWGHCQMPKEFGTHTLSDLAGPRPVAPRGSLDWVTEHALEKMARQL